MFGTWPNKLPIDYGAAGHTKADATMYERYSSILMRLHHVTDTALTFNPHGTAITAYSHETSEGVDLDEINTSNPADLLS